eukprot:GHVT01085039.1.p1 GENE.GHVT01085039.1~~GHVT01085039.1.p1  ORF type:complete len:408 (-),score=57.51 GHVT01085039.1:741-1964(-)
MNRETGDLKVVPKYPSGYRKGNDLFNSLEKAIFDSDMHQSLGPKHEVYDKVVATLMKAHHLGVKIPDKYTFFLPVNDEIGSIFFGDKFTNKGYRLTNPEFDFVVTKLIRNGCNVSKYMSTPRKGAQGMRENPLQLELEQLIPPVATASVPGSKAADSEVAAKQEVGSTKSGHERPTLRNIRKVAKQTVAEKNEFDVPEQINQEPHPENGQQPQAAPGQEANQFQFENEDAKAKVLQSRKKSAETFVAATPLVTETRTANTDAEASISVNAQESPNPPFEVNNYYGHPLAKPCSRPVEAFPQDLGTLGGVAAPGGGRATPSQGKPLKRLLPILVAAILVPTAIFGLLRLTPTSRPSKKGTGKPTTNKAVPLSAMSDSKQIDVIPLSGRNANVESRFDRCSSNLRKYNQ